MLPFEQNVAEVFSALGTGDAGRTVAQFASLSQANQYRLLYKLTAKYLPAGARVLDWGCGNGHFSFFLATQGASVTSYSFDAEPQAFSLLAPAQRQRITFVRGSCDDPHTLPFPDQSFECVFSIGVLEHVRETGGTEAGSLREIRRVLRPGGRFICYHLPNRYSYIEALNRIVYGRMAATLRMPVKYYHNYRFTKHEIRNLCEASGLSLLELHRYGAIPRNVLRRLPDRLAHSQLLASGVNALDLVLEKAMAPVSQNFAFVAVPRT